MTETLIYLFLLIVMLVILSVYIHSLITDTTGKMVTDTTNKVIFPIIKTADQESDNYLCSFLKTNDKILYRMQKNYSGVNREYDMYNQSLFKIMILILVVLFIFISILYYKVGLSEPVYRVIINFMVVSVSVMVVLYLVFLDDLREYRPVDNQYIVESIKKDMISELNK